MRSNCYAISKGPCYVAPVIDHQEFDWTTWRPVDHAVLCFLLRNDEVLLIHKKRGLGGGKINGPGGRLEAGESPLEAAVRETQEEVGMTPLSPEPRGELSFVFTDGYGLHVYVFVDRRFDGVPLETEEARPFWCRLDAIPYDEMWADDRLWLPYALAGKSVSGRFIFDGDVMLTQELEIT